MSALRPVILAHSVRGFAVHDIHGVVGRIEDFYFDDRTRRITNVVIDLGHWLPGRKVLVSPEVLGRANFRKKFIEARITGDEIRKCPEWDSSPPVSLQAARSADLVHGAEKAPDPHLQSTESLKGIDIATDTGKSEGWLVDFLIDTHTWEIRFLLLKANDGRVFLTHSHVVQSIDFKKRAMTIRHPDENPAEWLEYDPHYTAVFETGRTQ
jgi:sporulation protein YlmC with PRC-barrel domain